MVRKVRLIRSAPWKALAARALPPRAVPWLCLGWLALTPAGWGESPEVLAPHEARQAQLVDSTGRVVAQLDAIIEDFRLNGISGQDVQRLEIIRSLLQTLAAEDMQAVLQALRRAGQTPEPAAALNQTLSAYSGQKAVSAKLRAVIHEYLRLAQTYELAQRLREFAQRQSALMWRTVALARRTQNKAVNTFTEIEQSELRLLQIDQEPLQEELGPLLNKLEEVEAGLVNAGGQKTLPATSYVRESQLSAVLTSATQNLHAVKLHNAAGDQRTARNHLRELSRLLVLAQGRAAALRQAVSDLDQAADGQRQLMAAVEQAEPRDPQLEPRQAELADSTDLVRTDVEALVPAAGHDLKRAVETMNRARELLDAEPDAGQRRAQAVPLQSEALSSIAAARRAVQEQLELAEKHNDVLPETVSELNELLKQVRQLIGDQAALKSATAALETQAPPEAARDKLPAKAPAQGELGERAQSLQARAAERKAAPALGEAAAQMYRAQVSLAAAQNNAVAQQAALEALNRAEQLLQQELAEVQNAQRDLQRVAAILGQLTALIEKQQKLHFATARGASSAPLPNLSQEQTLLATNAASLKTETAPVSSLAASHLGNAQGHMTQAQHNLGAAGSPFALTNAVARQTDALKELYAARHILEKQAAHLQDKIGSTNAASTLAEAAAEVDQARLELERALAQMQAPPPGLLQALLQQQQQIVEGLNHLAPREQPRGASAPAPLRDAQAGAAHAAQALAQMDLAAAVASMRRARTAMEQATAAGHGSDGRVPALTGQQAQVQQLTETLLATQNGLPPALLAEAGEMLADAGERIAPLTAKAPQLPPSAQSSLQSAQAALAAGAAQAFAGQGAPAQANAGAAAEALAHAQSAIALAQAGLNAQTANSGQQGQVPGQGQAAGEGRSGGQPNSPATPNSSGDGRTGNWAGNGGANGPRRDTRGQGRFTGLPARERAALLQSQGEKYPQEYGPLIEQYLKNLADEPRRP